MENDGRYPYTYAADYVRGLAGYTEGGTKLSRSDASQVRQGIAKAIGVDDKELAEKLARYYLNNQDVLGDESAKQLAKVFGY
ncbi:hypothetical protein [Quatrionicoccus australiensis]|uniref:hypothetical protein n=1 Tax=Quatrionicoccus australiensis TaxID=138118 RepID=UPI001CFB7E0A|nr:hypothetical protein [Quatrionicoccus australiensis]MCB4358462.1 hypothetical protein [Quatrionicoccus australiensis]